jgi:hypothetical protein
MVSLLAGIIVAIGIAGLSKEAMNTFHEEARNAAAESGLRIGLERLRADLEKASFYSTGNIMADNQSLRFGGSIPVCSGQTTPVGAWTAGLTVAQRLAGIHLFQKQANVTTTAPASTLQLANGLTPDAIELGGNFTGGDEYVGWMDVVPPAGDTPCGTQVFRINMNTASGWRLVAAGLQAFTNAYQPGNPAAATRYMVRIGDNSNPTLYQYAALCATSPVYLNTAAVPPIAAINIDPTTPVGDVANSSGRCKLARWDAGSHGGLLRIAPVQVVHWDIIPATSVSLINYGLLNFGPQADPNNFVLTRQFVDITGILDPATLEVVAEYVVDMKFAFSVDPTADGLYSPPGAYPSTITSPLVHYMFDDTTNQTWAPDVSMTPVSGGAPQGPQRIRSVRARLATRTALPDRTQSIAGPPSIVVPPPPNETSAPPQSYLLRYCLGNASAGWGACPANTLTWTRVRTDITEVALPNQRHFFY